MLRERWISSPALQQAQFPRPMRGLRAVVDAELLVDVSEMDLNRVHGDMQLSGNLKIRKAFREQRYHIQLPPAQGFDQ